MVDQQHSTPEFLGFLRDANVAGYASGSAYEKMPDGGERFVFENGIWRYVDTYYGSNPFSGDMMVFRESKPFWRCNYMGWAREGDAQATYGMLREALKHPPAEFPVRGPSQFRLTNKHAYYNEWSGDIKKFAGQEIIKSDANFKRYTMNYHGLCL